MKVSIICACKNRSKPLYASIGSWLLKEEICEVIIVDWSSDESISDIINLDSRVKVIRVNGEKYFNMSEPLNLAASIATGDAILTMATDYFFNPYDEYNFFKAYPINDTSFVCGMFDYDRYPKSYEPIFFHLRGLLYVSRENFLKVGGYREGESKYYGNEDDELIYRLEKSGLEKKLIDPSYTIFHIPHTDQKRIENFEGYHTDQDMNDAVYSELSKKYTGDQLKWQFNYVIAQRHIRKNFEKYQKTLNFKNTKWDINKISDQYYDAKKKN
tara:strand:+ start:205 stop:1017 length:813 start_codon:yes stop_codon:yes gene_type:complete